MLNVNVDYGLMTVNYLEYDKPMTFKANVSTLKYKLENENHQGYFMDGAIVIGPGSRYSGIKEQLKFYTVGPWTKEELEKAFTNF